MQRATLVQLETFERVAALGSFTRAARELHLTQPAVTQQVRALERCYGVRLIDIVRRRPVLTEAGRFLAARAIELLGGAAALEREIGEYTKAQGGSLLIGATLTIGSYVLPSLLAEFARLHPAVQTQVAIANTEATIRSLRAGELSLALVEGGFSQEGLDARVFQVDQLCLITPPDHRLAGQDLVDPHELVNECFVWREPGSGTRALAERTLATAGIVPRIVLELPSGEGIARAVEGGIGISLLSHLIVQEAVLAGRLWAGALLGLDLTRSFQCVTIQGRTLSPNAYALIEQLRSTASAGRSGRDAAPPKDLGGRTLLSGTPCGCRSIGSKSIF